MPEASRSAELPQLEAADRSVVAEPLGPSGSLSGRGADVLRVARSRSADERRATIDRAAGNAAVSRMLTRRGAPNGSARAAGHRADDAVLARELADTAAQRRPEIHLAKVISILETALMKLQERRNEGATGLEDHIAHLRAALAELAGLRATGPAEQLAVVEQFQAGLGPEAVEAFGPSAAAGNGGAVQRAAIDGGGAAAPAGWIAPAVTAVAVIGVGAVVAAARSQGRG